MDTVLIQGDKAHQIWRGQYVDDLRERFHPDLVANMREVSEGTVQEGDLWDGSIFKSRPPPPPRDFDGEADVLVSYVDISATIQVLAGHLGMRPVELQNEIRAKVKAILQQQ